MSLGLPLTSGQCVQRSLWSVGWPQGLALPWACMWAIVAIIAVVCSAFLCGSLPWTDHCFDHHICSLLAQLSFVGHSFGRLFCQFSAQSFPGRKWFMVGNGYGKFLHWSSISVTVLIGGRLQGWFPLTGLPWNLPALPGIFAGLPPVRLRWHQFPSSWIGNEFKLEQHVAIAFHTNMVVSSRKW